jgi:thiol-disulfide isomerase/thioredoxin
MVLLSSKKFNPKFKALDFSLPGITNQVYDLNYFKNYDYLLVVFMCVHCPYVQAIESELIYLKEKYQAEGFEIIAINPNNETTHPDDSLEGMQARARQQRYNFVYLHDFDQDVAKAYDAVCTPDIYLFNQKRELIYRGRIKEVNEIMQNQKEGKSFDKEMIPSQGCSIKWRD